MVLRGAMLRAGLEACSTVWQWFNLRAIVCPFSSEMRSVVTLDSLTGSSCTSGTGTACCSNQRHKLESDQHTYRRQRRCVERRRGEVLTFTAKRTDASRCTVLFDHRFNCCSSLNSVVAAQGNGGWCAFDVCASHRINHLTSLDEFDRGHG